LPIMPALPLGRTYNRLTYDLAYLAVGGLEYRYLHKWRKSQGMSARRIRPRPDYTILGRPIPVLYAISPLILPRAAEWSENIHMVGFMQPDEAEPFTPSPGLAAFLKVEPRPLYIGFGSMTSGDMGEALGIVLRTLRALGLRAVLSKGWGGMTTDSLPEYVYLTDYVPHSWLFEQVCAVVHHGGAGTTAAGLRAGLPTLVVPFGGDQPFWGRRIYELGLGPKPVPRSQLTEQSLEEALSQLVGNASYRTAAREMQRNLQKEDGAARAADVIERELPNGPLNPANGRDRG
ncbi:MAG TPA: glycosyltransferase, partial [Clostridia bacterium]|nr:glycosyltransferase [Clostridia bacterium]